MSNADAVVVIAGDKVPSVHLHAQKGSLKEITRALSCVRGKCVLLDPLATNAQTEPAAYSGLFDAAHSHTIISANILLGSSQSATYEDLRFDRRSYEALVGQMSWQNIAEIELYRGCMLRAGVRPAC